MGRRRLVHHGWEYLIYAVWKKEKAKDRETGMWCKISSVTSHLGSFLTHSRANAFEKSTILQTDIAQIATNRALFPVKLFRIHSVSAVISPSPRWKENTHPHPHPPSSWGRREMERGMGFSRKKKRRRLKGMYEEDRVGERGRRHSNMCFCYQMTAMVWGVVLILRWWQEQAWWINVFNCSPFWCWDFIEEDWAALKSDTFRPIKCDSTSSEMPFTVSCGSSRCAVVQACMPVSFQVSNSKLAPQHSVNVKLSNSSLYVTN